MDCSELIFLISDYLDHELNEEMSQIFEEHIETCEFCGPFYYSMIKTIKSFSISQEIPLPKNTHQKLRRRLIMYSRTVKIRRIR